MAAKGFSGIDTARLDAIIQAANASRGRSGSSASDAAKWSALAAAFGGASAQSASSNDPLKSAQIRLANSIANINNSDAPLGSKKNATKQADTGGDSESFLTKALNILGKSGVAVRASIAGALDDERNYMKDLRNNVGTRELLDKADWFKGLPNPVKIAIGIGGDIITDPLTYLTGSGVISAAGGAAGISEKLADAAVALKAAGKVDDAERATKIAGNLLRKGKGGIGGVSNADLKWIGEVTGLADETGKALRGGVYFQAPLTGRVGSYAAKKLTGKGIDSAKYQMYLGRGPLVQAVSAGASNSLAGIKTSKLMSEIGEKYGGGSGKIKRGILNAESPQEALRLKATYSGTRMGEGAGAAVMTELDQQATSLMETAKKAGVEDRIAGVLDNNDADILFVDRAVGNVPSVKTGELIPFSQRLREFDDQVIELADDRIDRIAKVYGVDRGDLGDSVIQFKDAHYKGMLSDEAQARLDELANASGKRSGSSKTGSTKTGLEGSQIRSAYDEGQTFLGESIGSTRGDLAHAYTVVDGEKVVIQPTDRFAVRSVDGVASREGSLPVGTTDDDLRAAAINNMDGNLIENNERAAQEWLDSKTVKRELKQAREKVKAARTPEEAAVAKQELAALQARHQQEAQSLWRVRVQRNGQQSWEVVPTSRIQTDILPRSAEGVRTQVNKISRNNSLNGFDFFNMNWGDVVQRQIGEIGGVVRKEVLATNLRRFDGLGGLGYAKDLGTDESILRARGAIDRSRASMDEAAVVAADAESEVLARQQEAVQFAQDNVEELTAARERLAKIADREGRNSPTPKRKQLAEIEYQLQDAMIQLDRERAALDKATENLRVLRGQLKAARDELASATDAAAAARAQQKVDAIEQQVADGLDEFADPVSSVSQAAAPEVDPMVKAQADWELRVGQARDRLAASDATPSVGVDPQQIKMLESDVRDAQFQFDQIRVEPNAPQSDIAEAKAVLDEKRRLLDEALATPTAPPAAPTMGMDEVSLRSQLRDARRRLSDDKRALERNRSTANRARYEDDVAQSQAVVDDLQRQLDAAGSATAVDPAVAREAMIARGMAEADDLIRKNPQVMAHPTDYERLTAAAENGNVKRVFEDIKTENARGFTPEMKSSVADASQVVAGDDAARAALRNPEIVAQENGVDAVVAASKAKEEAAAALGGTPASGPSVLSVPEDEWVATAQAQLDELKQTVARQQQYGTKNRQGRVNRLEATVAEIEQDWIAIDEKIRQLDANYAAETARRGEAAKQELAPLLDQLQQIKESIRIAQDAELKAIEKFAKKADRFDYSYWWNNPIARQNFKTAVEDGWTQLGRSTQVPDQVVEYMKLMERVTAPEELPSLFRYFDKLTTLFKKWAIASPGFISRNGFGGMFNNYLGGIDAGRYTEFLKADHVFMKARKAGKSVDEAFQMIVNPTIREGYRLLHASGVLAETDQVMDAAYGLGRAIGQTAGRSPNDIGVLSDNVLTRSVYKGNHRMERVLRGAAGLDAAIKTRSLDQIYETVFKLHFNYSDLNKFEVNVMKRVSPFYSWTRFNLPLQMEMFVRNPKAYNHYNIFAKNIEAASDPEDIVPSWMRDRMAVRLPWDTSGGKMYALPDLPLNSLQLIGNLDELGGQINPVIKTPIEMALDRKVYFGKSAPFREGMVAVPSVFKPFAAALQAVGLAQRGKDGQVYTRDKYLYAIEQFMPFMGRARRLLPDEAKYQDRLPTTVVNFLFGAGLRTNTESDKAGELYYRQQVVDQIAKDLKTLGFGGYVTWSKQVAVSRKPTEKDKNPYLTLIAPKGGLPANSPYTNVPQKMSTGQMLAALQARQVSSR